MAKTLDEKISDTQNQIQSLTGERANLAARLPSEKDQYDIEAAAGNWDAAHAHSDFIQKEALPRIGAIDSLLPSLKDMLQLLQDQKAIQLTAQTAVVNAANSNSANALNAQQQFDLQLAQLQNQQGQAQTTKAMEKDKADADAAKNKNYFIIGGIVFVVIIILGVSMYFKSKN